MNRMILGVMLASTMMFAQNRIANRKENQQDRIAQGVKSGSLTSRETSHLENKEGRLNKEIRNDRKANGGNLTNNEKRQINNQQNRLSTDIYRDKHNGATQHP
jgi:polyhydroxyalkanoate synthesis regulator phasin